MIIYKKWHDSAILDHILARHGKEPLNSLYYSNSYPDVYAAACRIFGSWGNAIEACGLDYEKIRKYRQWSKGKILDEIKRLQKEKEPLNSINIQKNHNPLYMAAVKRFKSWGKAVKSVGIDYEKFMQRRRMSKAEIKRAILELHQKNEDLAYPNMREKHLNLQAAAMKKIGNGSWALARKRCGIRINYRLPKHKRKIKAHA
jgi:hypothetical protein